MFFSLFPFLFFRADGCTAMQPLRTQLSAQRRPKRAQRTPAHLYSDGHDAARQQRPPGQWHRQHLGHVGKQPAGQTGSGTVRHRTNITHSLRRVLGFCKRLNGPSPKASAERTSHKASLSLAGCRAWLAARRSCPQLGSPACIVLREGKGSGKRPAILIFNK